MERCLAYGTGVSAMYGEFDDLTAAELNPLISAEPMPGDPAPFLLDPDDPAVIRCTSMFNRVLCSWASDLLNLRREGLATPGWRERVDEEGTLQWRRAA